MPAAGRSVGRPDADRTTILHGKRLASLGAADISTVQRSALGRRCRQKPAKWYWRAGRKRLRQKPTPKSKISAQAG